MYGENNRDKDGQKAQNDPADHKYSFRLNAEENTRFEKLLADSGSRQPHAVHQEIHLLGTDKGRENRQGDDGLLHQADRIPQTVPGCRQQLQPGGTCLEEQFRGETGESVALNWKIES